MYLNEVRMKNYYSVLQVSEDASYEIIKASYKVLVKKYHPDITEENKDYALEMTKLINEAYETLADPDKREEYNIKYEQNYKKAYTENKKPRDFDSEFDSNKDYEEKDGWGMIIGASIISIIGMAIVIYILRKWNIDWFWCNFVILVGFILLKKSLIEESNASWHKKRIAKRIINIAIVGISLIIISFIATPLINGIKQGTEESDKSNNEEETVLSDEIIIKEFNKAEEAYASSILPDGYGFDYYADNLIDSDNNTLWAEGVDGSGIGEIIRLDCSNLTQINVLKIKNGATIDEDTYYNNNRVKEMIVEFSDGTAYTLNLDDACLDYQTFEFEKIVYTESISFVIEDVYYGSKYDDTCITDIEAGLYEKYVD